MLRIHRTKNPESRFGEIRICYDREVQQAELRSQTALRGGAPKALWADRRGRELATTRCLSPRSHQLPVALLFALSWEKAARPGEPKKFDVEKVGPSPQELWTVKMHFQARIRKCSGIWAPHLDILRFDCYTCFPSSFHHAPLLTSHLEVCICES